MTTPRNDHTKYSDSLSYLIDSAYLQESRRDRDTNEVREPEVKAPKLEDEHAVDKSIGGFVIGGGIGGFGGCGPLGNRPRKPPLVKRCDDIAKKTEALTGIKIPSYLNTTVLNPVKYAETEQKRKLLWSKKDDSKVSYVVE